MKFPDRLSAAVLAIVLCSFGISPRHGWSQTVPAASSASGSARATDVPPASPVTVTIPGPLRSFLRMAAVSQKVSPDEVLPLVARNVVVEGYQYGDEKGHKPTEYLVLLKRYLDQAKELKALAGLEGVIRISKCTEAQPLLAVLGYKLRQPCGPATSVEVADPEKAFLTIDSGFPLEDLEETLQGGKPFAHPFPASQVPVLLNRSDWTSSLDAKEKGDDVIEAILRDPALARLYWALSRMDANTRASLRQAPGLRKLLPVAGVLDFYGSYIYIRANRVVVPGGAPAEAAWKNLVGAAPDAPAEFVSQLLEKDEGWLAVYFDALARIGGPQQKYFTDPKRLQKFYEALRGHDISPSPARPVFRPTPGLLLLMTRLYLDPNGQPHVPGNLEVWKEMLRRKSDSKLVREWAKTASHWNSPEQLVEGMIGLSRQNSKDGPLQVYLTLSEIDRGRSPEQRLSSPVVRLLGEKFSRYSNQYLPFSEFRALNNASITSFINVAEALDRIPDHVLKGNALGIFQSNLGLWQILARQEQIPSVNWNASWEQAITPFSNVTNDTQLFDAGRNALSAVLRAAGGKADLSQDEIIALLAGPDQTSPQGQQMRQELAAKMRSVLDAQRLVSLDTVLALGDGLNQMAQGKAMADGLISLAGQLREFEMPKPLFTVRERSEWAAGLYNNRHTALQMRTDLAKVIKSPGSPGELATARGQLVPFFRDTLVGLNYAYYEPPGAEMLHHNPLFVRAHDFSGEMTMGGETAWQTPRLFGRGWSASGGAHLAGSLADLPYVLATVEQDFIVPENVQSLIWEDLVPELMTGAVMSRWWRVSQNEMHAVALYQRFGEELLGASRNDSALRENVMSILSDRMLPQRTAQVEEALRAEPLERVLVQMMPSEIFYLAVELRRRFPEAVGGRGNAGSELESFVRSYPEETSWERLSRDFGVPHPGIALTYGRELLNVRPFPTFLGYSSRLLAESWDSNNLFWARLADEKGYSPVMLHRMVPELTRRMVAKIFASHLEDWPAVLRALRETGEEFRSGKVALGTSPSPSPAPAELSRLSSRDSNPLGTPDSLSGKASDK